MTRRTRFLQRIALAVLSALFPLVRGNPAAQTSTSSDAAISQLASRIAQPLQERNITKVIFADLKGPNGAVHPVGRWAADQLARVCSKDFPSLGTIVRPAAEAENTPEFQQDPPKSVEDWARRVGANVVVTGTFARLSNGLGISLRAITTADSPITLGEATGLIPVTDEILALSPQAIPGPVDQTPRAGIGGVGIPQCAYCPGPKYSAEARKEKVDGSVVLQITVTADGDATNISIVRDPGNGLGQQAVEAVRKWRFKPALGPDGKPTAVIVPVEVTFHLH
jgi:TonB family protein